MDLQNTFYLNNPSIQTINMTQKHSFIEGDGFDPFNRYKLDTQKLLGKGSYGSVISAMDTKENKRVAIKKISEYDPKGLYEAKPSKGNTRLWELSLREIQFLRKLNHPNIIKLKDVMISEDKMNNMAVYLIQECMECSLDNIISSPQTINMEHVSIFIYKILCGVQYLHSANIIHRDLKPSNILVNSDCSIKICDFGLSCVGYESVNELDKNMTNYVVSRWYRPPEIFQKDQFYNKSVDMWSVGCILGELLLRRPMFKGHDTVDMLRLIYSQIGKPKQSEIDQIVHSGARRFVQELPYSTNITLKDTFNWYNHDEVILSEAVIDLLSKLLQSNPRCRLTVNDSVNHPFVLPEKIKNQTHNVAPFQEIRPSYTSLLSNMTEEFRAEFYRSQIKNIAEDYYAIHDHTSPISSIESMSLFHSTITQHQPISYTHSMESMQPNNFVLSNHNFSPMQQMERQSSISHGITRSKSLDVIQMMEGEDDNNSSSNNSNIINQSNIDNQLNEQFQEEGGFDHMLPSNFSQIIEGGLSFFFPMRSLIMDDTSKSATTVSSTVMESVMSSSTSKRRRTNE